MSPKKPTSDKNGNPIVTLFSKFVDSIGNLPGILKYGGVIVLAVLLIVLRGASLPENLLWFLGIITLSCLFTFALIDVFKPDGKRKGSAEPGTIALYVTVHKKGDKTSYISNAEVRLSIPDPQIKHTDTNGSVVFASIPAKYAGKEFSINASMVGYEPRSSESCKIADGLAVYISLVPCTAKVGASEDQENISAEPSVHLAIDRVKPLSLILNGRHTVYGTVRLSDGSTAYGEGFTIQLTLENLSEVDITIPTVDIQVLDHDAFPIETFKYSTLPTSGTHLEVPRSNVFEPVELTETNPPGSSIPVGRGRIFLRAGRGVESVHTLNFTLIARAPGVWRVQVGAKFAAADQPARLLSTETDVLCIVKR